MKKLMTFICLAFVYGVIQAQTIDDVLRSVERNNLDLQARRHAADAARMEEQVRNNLEDPTVEYSPFFAKGVEGMASSELVVSQGFDFPTVYAARKRTARLRQEAIDRQADLDRQDILLNAKNLCLDLILLNQQHALLSERKKNADELLSLYQERLERGDANLLEVNKIKMERMSVQTEVSRNDAAHRTALQQLLAMNGNLPLEFSATDYPRADSIGSAGGIYEELLASDASLLAADASARAASQEVSLNRQNWLPKLEIGYRRNTAAGERSNGFLIGGSLPLFSNRKKLKIARAQALTARLQSDEARVQAEARVQGQLNELRQLREALQAYDVSLMRQTLDMLKQSVSVGRLSLIDYYVEADNIYQNLQAYMQLENQYQKLVAAIRKNRL